MANEVSPHDIDAEKHVLGSMMIDPDAVHRVIPTLGDQTTIFFKAAHQLMYAAALRLVQRNDPIDIFTLTNELKRSGDIERVGSVPYLYEVQESVPTSANVEFYTHIVREKAIRRQLITAGTEIVSRAGRDEIELDEVIDQAQRIIFDVNRGDQRRGFVEIEQALTETMEHIEALFQRKDKLVGTPTGLPDLDQLLSGLNPSDLLIVAARPSMGKSAFVHNIAANIAIREGKPVALFTLEMGREQIVTRLLATEGRIDMQKIRSGNLNMDDWNRLSQAAGPISESPLYINDAPGISIMEIRSECRRLKLREPELSLVVIDYLQLMSGGSIRSQSREQEISEYSRSLKELARELSVPVIALSQLNRAVESRPDKRPQLSDLRESGAIEQDADIVMFLYRDDYYNPESSELPGQVEVIVRKHRNGPLGTVTLGFQQKYLKFEPLDGAGYY
ncbi:MAG: replicative DNA helicase [Candidatus Poribacteria bacterium]|nr:replicative DNA helicase [Candidatus Poribacteria bacterium]